MTFFQDKTLYHERNYLKFAIKLYWVQSLTIRYKKKNRNNPQKNKILYRKISTNKNKIFVQKPEKKTTNEKSN